MIDYHDKPEVPGQKFFSCPMGLGTFSTTFCAGLHKKARTKAYIQEHRRHECRFCPVGALHSGERDTMSGSRLYGSLLCARCERSSNRLVDGRICVSCYNREHENIAGKNAKGNPLKLVRNYYPVTLLIVKQNAVQLRVINRVMNLSEAVNTVLLKDSEAVVFGESENGMFIEHAR